MLYLHAVANEKSSYPVGTLFYRHRIEDNLFESFIEWQKGYNPTVDWVIWDSTTELSGYGFYLAQNYRSEFHFEWVFRNEKFKLIPVRRPLC